MNENRIIQALQEYQGTQDSLTQTVGVLVEELGDNWTNEIFQKLGGLPVELKEKLDHVFNYYAALTAWQETQSYLEQEEPFSEEVFQRLPILKHWLEFFGEPGEELYRKLEAKTSSMPSVEQSDSSGSSESETIEVPSEKIPNESVEGEETTVVPEAEENSNETIQETFQEKAVPQKEDTIVKEESSKEIDTTLEQKEKPLYNENSPEFFAFQKAQKEIALLDSVQAWLSARCFQLNNMEVFAYPYYGFAVDLMRQTVKDIQTVLDAQDKSFIGLYPDGEEGLLRKKQAVEADIETAVQNCESATTALIDENMDMDKVRKTLGDLDQNTEPEYLGPAPDGFELLEEDDKPLDETAVKEQYQQLEKEVSEEQKENDISSQEKKTSQKSKNSVQRKLSFSFKPKKTGG